MLCYKNRVEDVFLLFSGGVGIILDLQSTNVIMSVVRSYFSNVFCLYIIQTFYSLIPNAFF